MQQIRGAAYRVTEISAGRGKVIANANALRERRRDIRGPQASSFDREQNGDAHPCARTESPASSRGALRTCAHPPLPPP